MTHDNCYQLGHITRTHGTKGEVVFFLDVDYPDDYEELESVFIEIKGELVPYFVENINIQRDNKAIVKLEEIGSIEAAKALINCALYLPDDNLESLDESRFYYHEIAGFEVIDQRLGKLGLVKTVYTMAIQDLIAMQYQGQEVLIPVNDDIVLGVERDKKILNVNLPEGLIDVYLSETSEPEDGQEEDLN
ncbi:MAG: ribosome maturation factor RimM [Spirosomaceae bacterium]|jgi:16S rRNA processing protein RimM|nr:ribosome maturation factor RimM [Spirosomataceae bacterium]